MSTPGRGRGYTGRHHMREPRPGDTESTEELDALRTLAELSPRSTDPSRFDINKPENRSRDTDSDHKTEKPAEMKYHSSTEDELILQEMLKIDEQYTPLLSLLEQFSPGEDGIQFNRKLRHFESTITSMCPDDARLQQAFSTFRAAALQSSVTARKLAAVGASFTRQQRQHVLRITLLNVVMQGTYSHLSVLERSSPSFLINAANLLGDYFTEARLCNGNKVHILASPLLHYMRALLASDDIRAHRSLATQLMQNGRELLSVLSQELDELSISIRLRLLTPPPVSIIWLLLSADLCLNKFLPLPNTLQQFYASHLDLATDENYSEVSYGSWKKSPDREEFNRSDISSDSNTEKVSHNLSQISLNHDDQDTKPKLRPILGAGAGLLRQEQAMSVSQDSFETWTPKTNLAKRYDLNSWRQSEEETGTDDVEPVFNPAVLPPNLQQNVPPNIQPLQQNLTQKSQNYSSVPDYPPPNVSRYNNYTPEKSYLQQGDGTYIQNQVPNNTSFTSQGDGFTPQYAQTERPQMPDKVNNEIQKTSSRKAVENWRREKSDLKEDSNKNKQRNWPRQRSKDNINDDDDKDKNSEKYRSSSRNSRETRSGSRLNRRNSSENESVSGKPQRRHVTDVPRSQKYWDHDDRCDKDYNS